METGITIKRTLDCQDMLCPGPIVELSKAIKTIEVGQILEMLTTDPGSVPDVEGFRRQTGHEVVRQTQENGVFRFLVRRTK